MKYEWDPVKAELNFKKHDVSFEEALAVFDDPASIDLYDDAHSDNEPRFNIIGLTESGIVFVVYTERAPNIIRIISARKATKYEEKEYFR